MSDETYSPLVQKARNELWGDVGLVEDEDWEEFYQLPRVDQARYLGARVSCPVVESLARNPNYGPKYQVPRYGNVALMFGLLLHDMREAGVPFAEKFGAKVDLTDLGGIRKHDEGWVPDDQKMSIKGTETYEGFVLTRQMLDLVWHEKDPKRAVEALEEAERTVLKSQSFPHAVANLGRLGVRRGLRLRDVHARIFPSDWTEEVPLEYAAQQFSAVVQAFEDLWLGSPGDE